MLNRTNETLSANLNRLNLGTRTLAGQANGNLGMVSLRSVLAHGEYPRGEVGFEIPGRSSISIRHRSWHLGQTASRSTEAEPRASVRPEVVAPVRVVPGRLCVDVVMPQGRYDAMRGPDAHPFPSMTALPGQASLVGHKPTAGLDRKCGRDRDAILVRADQPAVATHATAGG